MAMMDMRIAVATVRFAEGPLLLLSPSFSLGSAPGRPLVDAAGDEGGVYISLVGAPGDGSASVLVFCVGIVCGGRSEPPDGNDEDGAGGIGGVDAHQFGRAVCTGLRGYAVVSSGYAGVDSGGVDPGGAKLLYKGMVKGRGSVSRLSRSSSRHRICIAGPTVTWAPIVVSVRETPQTPPRKSVVSEVQT